MKQSGVYIIKSLKNNRYYIGSTNNINLRLDAHNKGLVKATRNIKPFTLRKFIECDSITEAKKSEYRLKKYKRKDILDRVISDGKFPWNYSAPIA